MHPRNKGSPAFRPRGLELQGLEDVWVGQRQEDHFLELLHRVAQPADALPALKEGGGQRARGGIGRGGGSRCEAGGLTWAEEGGSGEGAMPVTACLPRRSPLLRLRLLPRPSCPPAQPPASSPCCRGTCRAPSGRMSPRRCLSHFCDKRKVCGTNANPRKDSRQAEGPNKHWARKWCREIREMKLCSGIEGASSTSLRP